MKAQRNGVGRPLAELAADPENAREIGEAAAAGLGASLRQFGDLGGVVWDAGARVLIAGHQRLDQLRAAGAQRWTVEQECGHALTPPDGEGAEGRGYVEHPETGRRFAVRLVRWKAATRRAANLTANNPHIAGGFTAAALPQIAALAALPELAPLRLDALSDDLRAQWPAPVPPEDEPPEPPAVAVSRRGDLWLLGEHRLACGDSTQAEDVARVMGGERAVLMATDWRQGSRCPFYGPRNQDTIWEVASISAGERREMGHATPKPVRLWQKPLTNHTRPGEVCYEPFSGSFTQGIAAEQLGRRVAAIEIEPRYVDVGIVRWERLTGKSAVLDGDGRTFSVIARERASGQCATGPGADSRGRDDQRA